MPGNNYTGPPAVEQIEAAVLLRHGSLITKIGQYNRRYIAGKLIWSQHAWGNAPDIHVDNLRDGDVIFGWLVSNKEALGIRQILWRVSGHYDHLHVDVWPKGVLVPPLSSTGVGTFRYSDGRTVSAQLQKIAPEKVWNEPLLEDLSMLRPCVKGDSGPHVVALQTVLTACAKIFPECNPGEIDGKYGDGTAAAVLAMRKVQGSAATSGDVFNHWAYEQLLAVHVRTIAAIHKIGQHAHEVEAVDEVARTAAAGAMDKANEAHVRLNAVKAVI